MPGTKAGGHAATKKTGPSRQRTIPFYRIRYRAKYLSPTVLRPGTVRRPKPVRSKLQSRFRERRSGKIPSPGRGGGSSSARLPPSAPGRRRPCRLPAGSGTTRPDPMARHAGHPPAPVRPMRGSAAKLRSLSNPPRRAIFSGHRSQRQSGRIPRPWNPCRRPAHTCPASDSGPQRRQSGRGRPPADRE